MSKAIAMLAALCVTGAAVAASPDPLLQGFQDPPNSARPRVWWHWMNGNVTQDGIAKDIAWMKSVGIGGLQNFDASLGTPQVVEKRLPFMSPEWKQAFRFAAEQAEAAGLELAIAASPGWSETGGPWVAPKDGIKKLVWSETELAGGRRFNARLPEPPATTGPFQTIAASDPLAAITGGASAPPKYYADVAVLAFPIAISAAGENPVLTSQDGGALESVLALDADLESAVKVPAGNAERTASVTVSYRAPVAIRSATLYVKHAASAFADPAFLPTLEARESTGWRKLGELPLGEVPTTISFAPVTAQNFRVVFAPNTAAKRIGLGEGAPGAVAINFFPPAPADQPIEVADLRLSTEARIDRFEAKAAFSVARDYYALSAGLVDAASGVAPDGVIDLTSRLQADGRLDWTPPAGRWRVLRLGYSLTGKTNHPATPEATGLEVDKFDGVAVRNYLQTYLGMYSDAVGAGLYGAKGLRALLTDSIEIGATNWTPRLIERFRELRGYDPLPWLPALTGTLVGTRAQSDAFLYDFRRTLADLMASDHYGTVAAVAREQGLTLYGEALEDVRPTVGDDMAMRAHADVPMAAMWSYARESAPRPTLLGDMKGAASVAHVYGQNLVAAESLTSANSPWAFAPADLRRMIDLEFAHGINRPVIHTSVHQPLDDRRPGLSLAIFGQYFNRHDTWAGMARPWVDYIARNSFMLQQGRNFADVAYFYGEEQPITALYAFAPLADTPTRYAFDFVNVDVLANRLSVVAGDLVAASGARYRVLYLGGTSQRMTLPVLRRIATLVDSGATVVGMAPQSSPGLKDDAAEFQLLVRRLWPGSERTTVGRGRVIATRNVEAALQSIGVAPDFSHSKPQPDSELLFVHRRLNDGDAYFVNNRRNRAERVEVRFRINGRQPEIWRADAGVSEMVSYRIEGDETVVLLELAAEDSFFVVFRKPVTASTATVAARDTVAMAELAGPWEVAFQAGRGAPASMRLDALQSLSVHADAGVRYFSGTATYTKRFTLPRGVKAGEPLWLDLGSVGDVAEVVVNGRSAGIAWKPPYRLDIGAFVRRGDNQLEIRVANLWVNRLIGDAQPNASKVAFTVAPTYLPNAPLRPSGLMGPVRLLGSVAK